MDTIDATRAGPILRDLIAAIVANAGYLGELDGAIGDGDHGINMSKGFRLAGERLGTPEPDLATGFERLSDTLLGDIGGSMGPLYGTFFGEMAERLKENPRIDKATFAAMLHAGVDAVRDLGGAKPGDKTLLDVLVPATEAFDDAAGLGADFAGCLDAMKRAAQDGLESTRAMVARIGRAARLGERSRGTLDAGAASSQLILVALADGLKAQLAG